MGSHTIMVSRKNLMVINFTQSRVLIDFSCSVSKIHNSGHSQRINPWEVVRAWFHEKKIILAFYNILAHGKSYELGFMKKRDGHKLCAKCGKGGGSFYTRQLAIFRARDAMDARGQMRYSASHTAPLFQQDAPPLGSSQRPPLVATQRNAPLQQPRVPSQ
ncbi:hypothetical protein B296_00007807 [Ensete ventricosum]|uniref:Uncharacterized protein n=1 Tax=Ensete ventricosum TaxID=4639 RepID=A0A426Z4Q1_ENSVE|nr:hypothetical protein B296_00007807 [Ensete ventricosum]